MTLTEFLLARIAEDEAEHRPMAESATPPYGRAHVRVLAECEAKRKIIQQARHAIQFSDQTPDDGSPEAERIHGYATAYETVLDSLVLIYAGHPDYREEWKP